ncbi:hypothetical protein SLEP1_g40662 [Rubroshorea leprosula]|uniref:snRNA-activating protein complex subunit n=1 Tax=Rubroshorea leprosula TaxID=152421 RepID=A0AAV5L4P9_9ROSI|nr:hypothetical protein SLEP1_g40662 [Rubroshorea leprosula]
MVEEDNIYSIPRGGPIYTPTLVSALTRVPYFQNSILRELHDLKLELDSDSSLLADADDISVDDLKILSDKDLVELALKEAFKEGEDGENASQVSEKCPTSLSKNKQLESSHEGDDIAASSDVKRGRSSRNCSNGTMIRKKKGSKKRRRKVNNHPVESYVAKVEGLAKVKLKQDEDKATARLHCLSASSKINDCAIPSSEGIERMKSLKSTNSARKVTASDIKEHIPVACPEVVLCVEVYHNIRKWSKTQEFLVLGQQTLTELRDKIYCLSDQVMQKAGKHDPSGYFLIEDMFYNDLRDPSATDYSKPILDWLKNSKDDAQKKWDCILTGQLQKKHKAILGSSTNSQLPHFGAVDMNKTQFCDLRFRLGAGYLYCHQGDCKHTVVIRDMRLFHPEDVNNWAAYPIVIFQQKTLVQKCNVCNIYRGTKVTVDDKWAMENPCYFCDHCYALLHSEDGPSYSNFSVYDYLHD